MSVIEHRRNVAIPATVGQANGTTIASTVSATVIFVRKAMVGSAKFFVRTMQAVTEARMHQVAIEVELYRNRYKHSSKNDDDLPIVR
jgi:hypothetical protein